MSDIKQRWLEVLIQWCKLGSKEHAWHTAKELEKNELLAGIANELEQHMKQYNAGLRNNGG